MSWFDACALADIPPACGVAALIAERQIAPDSIISVMLQPGSGMAIGDSEAKYRVIYRA